MKVAVLFARSDSIYKEMADCDVYDIERDALTFGGGMPVIAHPPCRSWGNLAQFAKPRPGERELALWAVDRVRENGGVLEHPVTSKLWKEKPLPAPGQRDEYGGFTVVLPQWWFGHRCQKMTSLYICGCSWRDLPPMELRLGEAEYVVSYSRRKGRPNKKEIGKAEREKTPQKFAEFLVEIARQCGRLRSVA